MAIATVRGGQPWGAVVYYRSNADGSDPLATGDTFEFAPAQTDEEICCVVDSAADGPGPYTLNPECPDNCGEEGSGCDVRYHLHRMTVTLVR